MLNSQLLTLFQEKGEASFVIHRKRKGEVKKKKKILFPDSPPAHPTYPTTAIPTTRQAGRSLQLMHCNTPGSIYRISLSSILQHLTDAHKRGREGEESGNCGVKEGGLTCAAHGGVYSIRLIGGTLAFFKNLNSGKQGEPSWARQSVSRQECTELPNRGRKEDQG